MEKYSVEGCPVWYGFFNTFDRRDEKTMRKKLKSFDKVNGKHEITIVPYQDFGDGKDDVDIKARNYSKKYTSSMPFTVGRVLSLIHESFMTAVDEVFDGSILYLSDTGLCGFKFDPVTRIVYPETQS